MFTKATIVLLFLFAVCEICTLIVFFYQRTVRKLALRLKLEQSVLSFCYPPWMMGMYWATFSKYVIAIALFILDWRCGLVAIGLFALFFLTSIFIPAPDGFNLIWIYGEVKRRGSKTIGIGVYQFLIKEIEKGIVVTGGDLEKIKEQGHDGFNWGGTHKIKKENLEWTGDRNSNSKVRPQGPAKETAIPQDVVVRTWNTAPASIKSVVVLLTIIGITLLTLGFVTIDEKNVALILPVCVGICFWLVFWAYQIFKGRNWTRVFAVVFVFLCIIGNATQSKFDFSAIVGGASVILVIAALLFCPGANKWFVSWPRGWSYWPVLLVIAQIVAMLINQSAFERDNTNSKDGAASLQEKRYTRQVKYADINIDYVKAPLEKVLEAAQNGIVDAQVNLGLRYATGRGGAGKDQSESFKWYLMAAEQGNTNAMKRILNGYRYGIGVKRDIRKAIEWGTQLAMNGDYSLAVMAFDLTSGSNGMPQNWDLGMRCLKICAENGNGVSARLLGTLAKNREEARKWYGLAAEAGNVSSMLELGKMYHDGVGGIKNTTQAATWYYKAANKGNSEAMCLLGCCYMLGDGVDIDEEEGVAWLQEAARKDYGPAKEVLQKLGRSW